MKLSKVIREYTEEFGIFPSIIALSGFIILIVIGSLFIEESEKQNKVTLYVECLIKAEQHQKSSENMFKYINDNEQTIQDRDKLMKLAQILHKQANKYYLQADSINKIVMKADE